MSSSFHPSSYLVRNKRSKMSMSSVTGQSGRSAARSGILCDDVLSSPQGQPNGRRHLFIFNSTLFPF